MVRLFSLRPFLLSLLWLVMSTRIQADETVTKTVVLVQATNGFVSLTGTAASAALHTLASGNLAGTIGDDSPQDGLGVPAGGVGSLHTGDGGEGKDSGSYSISIGAIAGIAVGVGLLVIGICRFHRDHCSWASALTALISRDVDPLVPQEEARLGDTKVRLSRLSSPHRPLQRQTQSPRFHAARRPHAVAATESITRARCREGRKGRGGVSTELDC